MSTDESEGCYLSGDPNILKVYQIYPVSDAYPIIDLSQLNLFSKTTATFTDKTSTVIIRDLVKSALYNYDA